MKNRFSSRYWLMASLALLLLFLTACGRSSDTWPGVAIDSENNNIIVSYNKAVTSLNADKERNWIYEYEGAQFFAPALITDDVVYVGDFEGRFHAIDRESGDSLWIYEPERPTFLFITFGANDRVLAPAEANDDTVFFGTERGVFAVDINEGNEGDILWEFDGTEHSVWARPLYVEESDDRHTLFVASLDKHLYALDAENGDLRWKLDLEGAIPGEPHLDKERELLYLGTLNRTVFAINFDGEIVADYQTEGWVWGSPAVEDDMLYFGDLNGYLYALRLTDDGFDEVWKKQISEDALRPTPVIVDDVLVISSEDKHVYAINLEDQSTKWSFNGTDRDIDEKFLTNLVLTEIEGEPAVVMGTNNTDKIIFALSVSDGSKLWEYEYKEKDD